MNDYPPLEGWSELTSTVCRLPLDQDELGFKRNQLNAPKRFFTLKAMQPRRVSTFPSRTWHQFAAHKKLNTWFSSRGAETRTYAKASVSVKSESTVTQCNCKQHQSNFGAF